MQNVYYNVGVLHNLGLESNAHSHFFSPQTLHPLPVLPPNKKCILLQLNSHIWVTLVIYSVFIKSMETLNRAVEQNK